MTATVAHISTRREVYVHLDLDEPVDVPMLPIPLTPDPVVRALVILRTLDGTTEQPLLTLSTARGRYVHAGTGQQNRDDTLIDRFAHLIDAARERVAYLDLPTKPADPPRLVDSLERIVGDVVAVRHLGTTDAPALHTCRHREGWHPCPCPLATDHQHDQDGAACTLDEAARA